MQQWLISLGGRSETVDFSVCVKDAASLNGLIAAAGTSYALPSPTALAHCYSHRHFNSHTHTHTQKTYIIASLTNLFSLLPPISPSLKMEGGGERGPLKGWHLFQACAPEVYWDRFSHEREKSQTDVDKLWRAQYSACLIWVTTNVCLYYLKVSGDSYQKYKSVSLEQRWLFKTLVPCDYFLTRCSHTFW